MTKSFKMPPLRERGEDEALLASALAKKFALKMGGTVAPLATEYIRSKRIVTF